MVCRWNPYWSRLSTVRLINSAKPASKSFQPKEVSPWDTELAVCTFIVNGVPKRYRIMQ